MPRKPKESGVKDLDELLTDVAAMHEIARTDAGKRILRYLQRRVNARSSFVAGDPYATAFREGMRALYLHLRWLESVDPDELRARFEAIGQAPVWELTRDVVDANEEIREGDYV